MVDLIPIKKLYQYVSLQRQDLPEGRRYIYGEQKLPSVTTILSATKKDKGALDAWIARVGQEEADRIKNEASRVGTYLHEVIERMVAYRHLPRPTNWDMCRGYELGYKIINTYFQHVSEIWGSEVSLYYPEKYAGTTDLVGVYRDKPAIIDFKQSNKPKKRQWIEDYFCQLAAYALAHDKIHGTNIDNAVVLMAVRSDGSTAEFSTAGREFQGFKDMWMRRVDEFHESQS